MDDTKLDRCIALLERIAVAMEAGLATNTTATIEPTLSPYTSPDMPEGFNTVVGYFAEHMPSAFDMLDDPVVDTMRDGFWLTHQASKRGIAVVKVAAPPAFIEAGIHTVNAYPVALLEERIAA